jgi:hypothetical protein
MAATVYILGALTTLLCGVLLLLAYGTERQRQLLWSGLCFVGLTVSNLLLFVDLVAAAAVSMSALLYGLIWEGE